MNIELLTPRLSVFPQRLPQDMHEIAQAGLSRREDRARRVRLWREAAAELP